MLHTRLMEMTGYDVLKLMFLVQLVWLGFSVVVGSSVATLKHFLLD